MHDHTYGNTDVQGDAFLSRELRSCRLRPSLNCSIRVRIKRLLTVTISYLDDVSFVRYLTRYKVALATHKELGPFVQKLNQWVMEWADGICGTNPTFSDLLTTPEQQHAREFVTNHIKDRVRRVMSIVEREQSGMDRSDAQRSSRNAAAALQEDSKHLLETLKSFYEGPGEERREGPRHDNDFVDIGFIKIAPTDEELTSRVLPFLPANIPNAPHPFPNSSMQRLLDIQFRLLREELLYVIFHIVILAVIDIFLC